MKPKTKNFLINFFGALISNDRAMEGAKSNPWWVGLIIAILALLLPVIPITVTQARSYGSAFLGGNLHRFDQNIAQATVSLASEGKEFKVNDSHLLEYLDNDARVTPDRVADLTPVYSYISTVNAGESNEVKTYELNIYYSVRSRGEISEYLEEINTYKYKNGTITRNAEGDEEDTLYAPSYVVLYSEGIYARINKAGSTAVSSGAYVSYSTDWNHFEVGTKLIANALPEGKTAAEINLNKASERDLIFNKWKGYFDQSYLTQKTFNIWMTSLLFYGIYVGLTFILGVLLFLITRGKNNIFNYLKFIDTQKIIWWSTLSPAILAMGVGFFLTNFAQMIYIILIGLRAMWISMKQLRPMQQ